MKKKREKPDQNEIYREFDHLWISNKEVDSLVETGWTKYQIDTILDAIENHKNRNKYENLYLTAKNWLKQQFPAPAINSYVKEEVKLGLGYGPDGSWTANEFHEMALMYRIWWGNHEKNWMAGIPKERVELWRKLGSPDFAKYDTWKPAKFKKEDDGTIIAY